MKPSPHHRGDQWLYGPVIDKPTMRYYSAQTAARLIIRNRVQIRTPSKSNRNSATNAEHGDLERNNMNTNAPENNRSVVITNTSQTRTENFQRLLSIEVDSPVRCAQLNRPHLVQSEDNQKKEGMSVKFR